MHPEIAKTLVAQHRDELVQQTASSGGRPPPVPAVAHQLDPDRAGPGRPGPAGSNRAGPAGRRGSSLVIIISAHRSA